MHSYISHRIIIVSLLQTKIEFIVNKISFSSIILQRFIHFVHLYLQHLFTFYHSIAFLCVGGLFRVGSHQGIAGLLLSLQKCMKNKR